MPTSCSKDSNRTVRMATGLHLFVCSEASWDRYTFGHRVGVAATIAAGGFHSGSRNFISARPAIRSRLPGQVSVLAGPLLELSVQRSFLTDPIHTVPAMQMQ